MITDPPAPQRPKESEPSGFSVGPYRVQRRLGQGGMGEVHLARDTDLGRQVALKRLRPGSRNPEHLERLRQEATAVARLNHPAIVQVYQWLPPDSQGKYPDDSWIVMEWVDGEALETRLQRGPLPIPEALDVARQIASGLEAAHSKGLIHRDLKADNVMITDDGRVKILDFGLVKLTSHPIADDDVQPLDEALPLDEDSGQLIGTFSTMAPEQLNSESCDHRVDLFALGVLLYRMVNGRAPFEGQTLIGTMAKIRDAAPPPHRVELPAGLSQLFDGLLAKQPDARPESAAVVVDALDDIAQQAEVGAPSRGVMPGATSAATRATTSVVTSTETPPSTRQRWLIAALVLVLVTGVLIGERSGWFEGRPPQDGALVSTEIANSDAHDREAAEPSRPVGKPFGREPLRLAVVPAQPFPTTDDDTRFPLRGLLEEIVTSLGAVEHLSVIPVARAAEQAQAAGLKGPKTSRAALPEMARTLGVDYVLVMEDLAESSALADNLNSELWRTSDLEPIWHSVIQVNDPVTALYGEIAKLIEKSFPLTDRADESPTLGVLGTDDELASKAYFRGLGYLRQTDYTESDRERAITNFELATQSDPNFVLAWALLVEAHTEAYLNNSRNNERVVDTRRALDRAQQLDPEHPAVELATAYVLYRIEGRYAEAVEILERVLERWPSSTSVLEALAYTERRRGNMDAAIAYLERVIGQDPGHAEVASFLGETHQAMRRLDRAAQWFDRSVELNPDQPWIHGQRALTLLDRQSCGPNLNTCPFGRAKAMLAETPDSQDNVAVYMSIMLELYALPPDPQPAQLRLILFSLQAEEPWPENWQKIGLLGAHFELLRRLDGNEEARRWIALQRQGFASSAEADHPQVKAGMGLAQVLAGDVEAGLELLEATVKATSNDHLTGPTYRQMLAQALVAAGRTEQALDEIDALLASQYQRPLTPTRLLLDPVWRPLRPLPRFAQLIERELPTRLAAR